jgi:hypothetical protein
VFHEPIWITEWGCRKVESLLGSCRARFERSREPAFGKLSRRSPFVEAMADRMNSESELEGPPSCVSPEIPANLHVGPSVMHKPYGNIQRASKKYSYLAGCDEGHCSRKRSE